MRSALESFRPAEVRGSLSAIVDRASGSAERAVATGPECLLRLGALSFEVEIAIVTKDKKRRKHESSTEKA